MNRVTKILSHALFLQSVRKNEESEEGSGYCGHSFEHFTDVARIAHIINLENNYGFSKEIIYATALLHDITKWMQTLHGIPHNESAVQPAAVILKDCGFSASESEMICTAIIKHRKQPDESDVFSCLIFQADKLSRPCFLCDVRDTCKWDFRMKNASLHY